MRQEEQQAGMAAAHWSASRTGVSDFAVRAATDVTQNLYRRPEAEPTPTSGAGEDRTVDGGDHDAETH